MDSFSVPQVGDAVVIPADGDFAEVYVRRFKETGNWEIVQSNMTARAGLKLSRPQLFALRTILSQDSWA